MGDNLFYTIIVSTFLFFFLTFFIIYLTVFQNKKKLFFKQELLRSQIEIQEQTFNSISQEIHDNVGQILSLVKVQLNIIDESETTDKALLGDSDHEQSGLVGKQDTDRTCRGMFDNILQAFLYNPEKDQLLLVVNF